MSKRFSEHSEECADLQSVSSRVFWPRTVIIFMTFSNLVTIALWLSVGLDETCQWSSLSSQETIILTNERLPFTSGSAKL